MGKLYKGICDDIKVDGKWVQTYTTFDGVYNTISGSVWRGLVARNKKSSNAYKNCKIGFEGFQSFCEWNMCQPGYGAGWHLDKDLLSDSTVYSAETCCLLPPKLNVLMQGVGSWKRGEQVGACFYKRDNCWRAYGNSAYKQIHLGYCETRNEAHLRWRLHKAELLQDYNSCDLPPRLYTALQVLIENLQNTGYTPLVDNQRKETQT